MKQYYEILSNRNPNKTCLKLQQQQKQMLQMYTVFLLFFLPMYDQKNTSM